ncbi:Oxoglutarate/iron-dependent dioxygenase [Macleaya cordata]|uniref:Oxoglutarate/iron-dependent dioxygenase n=1 Tax=Macleaya cordata TaxID=56857 RepID=A0A200RBK2_MACCD|nr:Oxoglutarate/iron-dependent dioxygenase [Macleaya cordata]
MPMAAVPDRAPPMLSAGMATQPSPVPETFAKDAIIAWFRGEFAAANAIIDALCSHLTQLTQLDGVSGGGSEYEAVFAAIHRRRLNWIPILHMQKYFSIADVSLELKKVAAGKKMKKRDEKEEEEMMKKNKKRSSEEIVESMKVEEERENEEKKDETVDLERELKKSDGDNNGDETVEEDSSGFDDSSDPKLSDGGLQGEQLPLENIQICSNHDDCETRRFQIKMTKGFIAKEPVKGHMASSIFHYSNKSSVNVVKGLKLYEDIFTDSELSKLTDYIDQLRNAGRSGELSGDTFILFNQQLKGNKRELIQLGVPIFGQIKDEKTSKSEKSNIEPIPSVLQAVIDHLTQWHLIPESRKPNSCIINFFDEGEYSQPFLKPPHLDQPISTLLLSESTMAFGRVLVSDHNGNFKGPLMLSLKEGSLLVMRGNSADMAKHVICPSPKKRVSITFFKVRPEMNHIQSSTIPPLTTAMTIWQPGMPQPYRVPNGSLTGYGPMEIVPKWGVLHAPLVMLAPARPILMNPRKIPNNGTGVFLPWTMKSKKPAKHLPPRAQRARLLALPSPIETHVVESSANSAVTV